MKHLFSLVIFLNIFQLGYSQKKTTPSKALEKVPVSSTKPIRNTDAKQKSSNVESVNIKPEVDLAIQKISENQENSELEPNLAIATVLKCHDQIQLIEQTMNEKKISVLKDASIRAEDRILQVQGLEKEKNAMIIQKVGEKLYEIYIKTMGIH